jgi:coenzyme PQQ precursor peptide PqqA
MTWTAPQFVEICLNCEINSYASAKFEQGSRSKTDS